jgi:endogenous inhibitor of DNA gyrase (YacG/DUF329 family)
MYDRLRREVAYVKGVLEGTASKDPTYKALIQLTAVFDELTEALQKLDVRQSELEEYTEAIDEDLNDVELLLYKDDDTYTLTCPECGEDVVVKLDELDNEELEVLCPNCHTVLSVEDASDFDEEKEND